MSFPGLRRASDDAAVPRTWIRPYYRSFDGLRGLAILLVFLAHYGGSWQSTTGQIFWVGVDLFFVLSGFLITGILYDSLEGARYFKNFYVRRALRIFPLFYGFFLALLILTPMLHLLYSRNMLAFVFYVGNLTVPFTDLAKHNPTQIEVLRNGSLMDIGNIGNLWSLCVEEQFYLIWPALVWYVRDRKRLMSVCVLVSVLTLCGRIYLAWHPIARSQSLLLYWSTYTRWDTLFIGSWLALFLRGRALSLVQLRRLSSALFWIPVALLVWREYRHRADGLAFNRFTTTFGYTLVALAALGVLLRALDDDGRLSRVLRLRPLSRLGAISYGFYFFHSMPAPLWLHLAGVHPALINVIPVLAFTSTLVLAWLSFHFYEKPFLRLKKVLAPEHRRSMTVEQAKV